MTMRAAVCLGTLATVILGAPLAAQRTPEQRYFEWTTLAFPADEYAARRAALGRAVTATGGGVFLAPAASGGSQGFTFRQLDTFWYLTGLEVPDAVLAIDVDRATTTLFAPVRDARFENPTRANDFPGRPLQADPALAQRTGLVDIQPLDRLDAAVAAWAGAGRTLRIEGTRSGVLVAPTLAPAQPWTPLEHFHAWLRGRVPTARVENAYADVARVRMVKSLREIVLMRRAARLGVEGIAHAARFVKDGIDERGLEAELEAFYKRGGAARLPFASIIKSGPNALWPWRILATHYDRRNRTMRDGELVVFDVGCELEGYVSDTGRTFPVSGRFSPEQRDILAMDVRVSDALIAALRPGVTLLEVRRAVQATIPAEARPYMQTGSFFGHHIGMSSSDPALDDVPLAPGMIVTVEPWYYNHDRGMSVFTEDVVLITTDGRENLTAMVPRTPAALEALVHPPERP